MTTTAPVTTEAHKTQNDKSAPAKKKEVDYRNPISVMEDMGDVIFNQLPMSVWLGPMIFMLGATGEETTRNDGFFMYVMFMMVLYCGKKLNDKIENSEWRQQLKRDAEAERSNAEAEHAMKQKKEEKAKEKKEKDKDASGSAKKNR